MNMKETSNSGVFSALTPDTILNLVEKALGIYLSNLCRPLNSYINRVYELEDVVTPSKEYIIERAEFLRKQMPDIPIKAGGGYF